VYFKEGWDRNLISVIVFSVSALASVLFGVLWAVYKVDTQGAFGVFAYCYNSLWTIRTNKNGLWVLGHNVGV
jgi:hypothetical protein